MRGKIICSSHNINREAFIHRFRDLIASTNHFDPKVRRTKKVLLITAGWQTAEYEESHLKRALNRIGIESRYDAHGYDINIQNLAIYHQFNRFKAHSSKIYQEYHEKQETIKHIKEFYRTKNTGMIETYWEQVDLVRKYFPDMNLRDILGYKIDQPRGDLTGLPLPEVQKLYFCQQVQNTLRNVIQYDEMMVNTIEEIESYFVAHSNVKQDALYQQIRNDLQQRILSSNSIFIFGGHTTVLMNRLRFFDLKETLIEALNRGTNFFTVGSGAEILCDKLILYNNHPDRRTPRETFEFHDNGLGLISHLQILPPNVSQINIEDADLRTHIANRFNSHTCVLLDKDSYLYIEARPETNQYEETTTEQRYIALGETDYLYIFNKSGELERKHAGEELFPGKSRRITTSLVHRDASPRLKALISRVHHVQRIKYGNINEVVQQFIQNETFPLTDGYTTTFFYFDPHHTVKSVYLYSSIGHDDDDLVFYQYKNTGIFYLPMKFQPVSRLEYKLMLDYGNQQYREILDPYHSHWAYGPFGPKSVMVTPDYRRAAMAEYHETHPHGTLEEVIFPSRIMGDQRQFQLYTPPDYQPDTPYPLVIFHDGYDYLQFSALKTILDNLIHYQLIRPVVAVFSKPVHRFEEYGANPKYAQFMVEEVIAHARQRRNISSNPVDICTVGASLGGVVSLYLFDQYPDVFGGVIAQSGSFFMNQEGFGWAKDRAPRIVNFVERFTVTPPQHDPKIVLTCGRFEGLIYINRVMAERLDQLGYNYRYIENNDGHTWVGWSDLMPTALRNIFGTLTTATGDLITPAGIISLNSEVQLPMVQFH